MKITIKSDAVLDSVYAESSLRSVAASAPGGYVSRLLTRSETPALRRLLDDAVAIALARLGDGWRLAAAAGNATISIEAPDDLLLDSSTVAAILSAALGRLCAAIILGTVSPGADTAYREIAASMLDNIGRRRMTLCSIEPCSL